MGNDFGLALGAVTEVADPEAKGRVRIDVPSIGISGQWAEVVVHARPCMAPAVKILVGFVGGDADYPVVLGALGPD
jgi:hypothetical protein